MRWDVQIDVRAHRYTVSPRQVGVEVSVPSIHVQSLARAHAVEITPLHKVEVSVCRC